MPSVLDRSGAHTPSSPADWWVRKTNHGNEITFPGPSCQQHADKLVVGGVSPDESEYVSISTLT